MERLFNDGWQFAKLPAGSGLSDCAETAFRDVDLPHDFLIANHEELYETCDGWYRRVLAAPDEWADKCVLLRFDGVYMDCDVLLNGALICTHHYGYTAFEADLSGKIHPGENVLMVHIRHRSPNSRWYSGAGIYRDVTLHVLDADHIPLDGTYVTASRAGEDWLLTVRHEQTGTGPVLHRLYEGGQLLAECAARDGCARISVHQPKLWHVDSPNLYQLETVCGAQIIRQNVGFREVEFTADRGMLLNGRHVKLHGACQHHDLGALGAAFHVKAARRQLLAMKAMGVNSLRTSHNPPARQIMDLCDELGLLVIDEILDMWQGPKTAYDYARFFDSDIEQDAASWVRRDRNHPCLLMWSIGNEIGDTNNAEKAGPVTQMLCQLVRRHDPERNGATTIGSNYMPWAGAQHCAQFVDAVGYNYGEKLYAQHHAEHPEWVIYGSETASVFASRGVYHFPMHASIMSDEDLQCSSLGNSTSSWGARDLRQMIVEDLNCPYSLGQFIWTAIDYLGEPTPYHTRSCYFAMMDTAVFPKDFFYLFKSLWTDGPMVHIGVHWDWNPGQMIDIPVMTNGAKCELFLNGQSLGVQPVDLRDWEKCRPAWRIPYAPGELRAVAYAADGTILAQDARRTPGDASQILLTAEDGALHADGQDMTFVTIEMLDETGNPVPNAADRVRVSVTGSGMLMGLDNGDSTDAEGYQTAARRLFSGKLLAIIGAGEQPGEVTITVDSPGKKSASLTLPVLPAAVPEGVSRRVPLIAPAEMPDDTPVRKIELIPLGEKRLTPDCPAMRFRIRCRPESAPRQPIALRITNEKGIDSPCATASLEGDLVTVTAHGDGRVFLRAAVNNGYPHPRVISQQEIDIEGLGQPNLNPYRFVSAGLYDVHAGEIGCGNEQGIAFDRVGESMVGFTNVDFGPVGSDEIELPIFALDSSRHDLKLWDGIPGKGGTLIAVLPYHKQSIWNVYQAQTWRLPRRLTGLHTLCFSLSEKVHLKGFRFTRQSRAWLPQCALAADAIYGDSFTRSAEGVTGIGNNVSLEFGGMDFGNCTRALLDIEGATPLAENPITVRVTSADGQTVTSLANFTGQARCTRTFAVDVPGGECAVSFVFLPGSKFDFYQFAFRQE